MGRHSRADGRFGEPGFSKLMRYTAKAVEQQHHTANTNTSNVHISIFNIQLNVGHLFSSDIVHVQFGRICVGSPLTKCHVKVC